MTGMAHNEWKYNSELQRWLTARVRAGMLANDMTQTQLAERVGVSFKHLSEMLNGWSMGTVDVWDRLLWEAGAHPVGNPE
jgi:DNA-binding transcriptional regulator LsrR (DeoR family)